MAKLKAPKTAGFNAGGNFYAKNMKIEEIVIDPEIADIFSIDDKILNEITEKIQKFGYDKNQPVVVWKGQNVLVDGRTRLTAARKAGKDEVPVTEKEFESREEAIMYTIERQVVRRNLTGPEILKAVSMLPKTRRKAADGTGRAAELIANKLGVCATTIYQANNVLNNAPAEILEEVKRGNMSIKKADKKTRQLRNPAEEITPVKEPEWKGSDMHYSEKLSFLKASVILLVEAGHRASAELVINHFLRKNDRRCFYDILPEAARAQLGVSSPVN